MIEFLTTCFIAAAYIVVTMIMGLFIIGLIVTTFVAFGFAWEFYIQSKKKRKQR